MNLEAYCAFTQSISGESDMRLGTRELITTMLIFLQDHQAFPNTRINVLARVLNEVGPFVLHEGPQIIAVGIGCEQDESMQTAIGTPNTLLHDVAADPISPLIDLVIAASQMRDIVSGNATDANAIIERAEAYAAEALRTLVEVGERGGIEIDIEGYHDLLDRYPEGLDSLPAARRGSAPALIGKIGLN